MRFRMHLFLVLVAFLVAGCTVYESPENPPPGPGAEVRIDFFYDALAPYGDWVLVDAHGWVWIPHAVPVGWRPYTHGRWVFTEYGWTWYSRWEWGWAPFHYGRWHRHHHHGWVWIPGRTWGPGWVAWRSGDGYLGWAPLPPEVRWRVGIGLDLGNVDQHVGIASDHWSFVEIGFFTSDLVHRHLVPAHRHPALLRSTRNVTDFRERHHIAVERGVPVERVERVLGRPVERYRIQDLSSAPRTRDGRLDRGVLHVYRPRVKAAKPGKTPAPKVKTKGKR